MNGLISLTPDFFMKKFWRYECRWLQAADKSGVLCRFVVKIRLNLSI